MKTNLIKYYTTTLFLCFNFVMLAQAPGNNDDNGALEGTDTPASPIDGAVWVLALLGLLFVFLKFKAIREQRAHSQA